MGDPLAGQQRTRVGAEDSMTAGDAETLTVTNENVAGRPFVQVYYSVGSDATIEIEGSNDDGVNWLPIDTLDTNNANTDAESTEPYPFYAYDQVRARVTTNGIDATVRVDATR